jgi:hypothetical protein
MQFNNENKKRVKQGHGAKPYLKLMLNKLKVTWGELPLFIPC